MEKSGRKESQSLETVRPIIKLLLRSNMFKQNISHTHTLLSNFLMGNLEAPWSSWTSTKSTQSSALEKRSSQSSAWPKISKVMCFWHPLSSFDKRWKMLKVDLLWSLDISCLLETGLLEAVTTRGDTSLRVPATTVMHWYALNTPFDNIWFQHASSGPFSVVLQVTSGLLHFDQRPFLSNLRSLNLFWFCDLLRPRCLPHFETLSQEGSLRNTARRSIVGQVGVIRCNQLQNYFGISCCWHRHRAPATRRARWTAAQKENNFKNRLEDLFKSFQSISGPQILARKK